jgi:putative ABC transport system ATP-binding protein
MKPEPIVRFEAVHHAFGSGELLRTVLHGVYAALYPGEIVILTGPSGSGKTTLLTLAGALRSVQSGSVKVFGTELAGADTATRLQVRRKIGFIFQSPNLLDALTAEQNVALALAWHGPVDAAVASRKAREMLALVGLVAHVAKLPARLSGGQRQRVAIARALVASPQLILADEPTSALDAQTGREVVEMLQRLARQQGCAILLVTHDHRILDIADRTLSLEDGRLVSMAHGAARAAGLLTAEVIRSGRATEVVRVVDDMDVPRFFNFVEESSRDLAELRATFDNARNDLAASQFDRLLVAATLKAGQWLDADRVTLFVIDYAAGKLRSRVAQTGTDELLRIEVDIGTGLAGHVAKTGEPLNLADAYDSPLFNRAIDQRTGYRTRAVLCLPVKDSAGRIIAVGQLLNPRSGGVFSENDMHRFAEFLTRISPLLENILAVESPHTSIFRKDAKSRQVTGV